LEGKAQRNYFGITNDPKKRCWKHNVGYDENCYSYSRRPVELRYFEIFTDVNQAIAREKQIKGWS